MAKNARFVSKYQIPVQDTGDSKQVEATELIINSIGGINPDQVQLRPNATVSAITKAYQGQIRDTYNHARKQVKDRTGLRVGELDPVHRSAIRAAWAQKALEIERHMDERSRSGARPDELPRASALRESINKLMPSGPDTVAANRPVEFDRVAAEREAAMREAELRVEGTQSTAQHAIDRIAGVAQTAVESRGANGLPVASRGASAKQIQGARRDFMQQSWGLSRTSAEKLSKQIDPFNPPKALDAQALRINQQVIRKLVAAGITVVNAPGQTTRPAGYTRSELVKSQASSAGTQVGQARLERQRGLFRRRTVFSRGADGTVEATTLDPRVTPKGIAKGIQDHTTGAVRRRISKRQARRERRRLDNPYHRITRVEHLDRNRRIDQLEGHITTSRGFRVVLSRIKLGILKLGLVHRAWLAVILTAAIFFVPWFGVLGWVAWSGSALIMSIIKAAVFVLVNVYNLLASSIVGGLDFIGNLVVGTLESLSASYLETLNIDPNDGQRLFHYEYTDIDLSFEGFSLVEKPSGFDNRTLVEILFGIPGLRFGFFNELLRWFRGGT